MTCPCCNGPWKGPPKFLGKTFMTPDGFAEMTVYEKELVELLQARPRTDDEIKHRKSARISVNSILRVIGWGITNSMPGKGGMHRLEKL